MRRTLLTLICLIAVSQPAWADATRLPPGYPFRVERSANVSEQISAARGEVIYREISRGRLAAFLTAASPSGRWPVGLDPSDPLFPISFQEKATVSLFYCPDKFTLEYKAPHQTVCFADRDKDSRFELAVIAERDSGFVFEITGRWIEHTMEAIEGNRAVRIGTPQPIAPASYAISQVRPTPEAQGVVEVRYAGLQKGTPAFDISFRAAASKATICTERRSARRNGASVRATLANPLVAHWAKRVPPQRMGFTGPFPQRPNPVPKDAVRLTSMTIEITSANANRISVVIERAYPAWSWYQQNCDDDAPKIVHVDSGDLPLLVHQGDIGRCEKATWVQGDTWWIVGTEDATSGPLNKPLPNRQ